MVAPYRHPKTGVYWFRQAVPAALQEAVATALGRPGERHRELKWTLGTKDQKEVAKRWPEALQRAQAILEAARNGAQPLTQKQQYALAAVWYRRLLAEWERDPASLKLWDGWDELDDDAKTYLPSGYVEELLADAGVVTDPQSKTELAELCASRLSWALARQAQIDRGDYSPDENLAKFPEWEPIQKPPERPTAPQPAVSLTGLFERWKRFASVKPRTVDETDYAVRGLVAFLEHDDARRLQKEDLRHWRDWMNEEGRSNQTFNNRLSLISQVVRFGVSEGDLKEDVTAGLRLPKGKSNSPLPFTDEDARKILLAARRETRPSLRWAHWVMAFTGMRAGEALQLTRGDVREESGIWYLSVNEDDETKSVKTGLRRNVPLHAALVAEGFLAYAQSKKGDEPLFPDKPLDKHGKRGGRAWNVIGLWVRSKVGIDDPKKAPDHSWRHRIEDELRVAGVEESLRDTITGHARKTTGRVYGVRGESLKQLAAAVAKIPNPLSA